MQEESAARQAEATLSAEELYSTASLWGIGEVLSRLNLSLNSCEEMSDHLPAWLREFIPSSFRGCWMRYHAEDESGAEFIHCSNGQIVFGEQRGEAANCFRLRREQRLEPLCGDCAIKACQSTRSEKDHSDLPAMLLSRNEFDALINELKTLTLDELTNRLVISSGDYEGSIALARSLKQPRSQGEILFYSRQSDTEKLELYRVRFVSTDHMNWILRESTGDSEDWLIASPSTRRKFQEMLESWLQHDSVVEAERGNPF